MYSKICIFPLKTGRNGFRNNDIFSTDLSPKDFTEFMHGGLLPPPPKKEKN
jgi:hypothetical protein